MGPVQQGAQDILHFAKRAPFVGAVSVLQLDFLAAKAGLAVPQPGVSGGSKLRDLELRIVAELARKGWTLESRARLYAEANQYVRRILDAATASAREDESNLGVSFIVGHMKDEARSLRYHGLF